ncbi:MAG: N-acetylmuramoyl-L-alanine amidase, partial [Clostridia bacterium]|nr:N-acetylmuramoyl-L-alanine amidase [Clostridia bacterium]
LPQQVRGVRLVSGVDFGKKKPTEESVKKEITAFLDQLVAWEFNTVLLPLTGDGKAYYESTALPAADSVVKGFDAIRFVLDTARSRGITVMAVLDLSVTDGTIDPLAADAAGKLDTLAKEAAAYRFDTVLLTDYGLAYGAEENTEQFKAQTTYDTYAAFAEATITAHIGRITGLLRTNNPGGKIGLLSEAVWAHKTVQKDGSSTDSYYEDYTDGYANTRAWITAGLFDMVMVKNYTSTEHSNTSFSQVLTWWDALCKTVNLPLYVEQGAHQMDADASGWISPDQLSLQWLECQKSESWKGSVFSSYAVLLENKGESISVLLSTIKGESDVEYIANKLVVSSPEKTDVTTNESAFTIRGSSDPNFPLVLNGKQLETTASHGLFAMDVTLKPGANTYTFEHKGTKVTYTIHYEVDVLTSVSPSQALTLEGGSEVALSAIARKGATVYAMVGSTKVPMKEAPLQSEESGEEESDFINFSGVYRLPAGKEYKTQPLGAFTVYVSWNGHSETMSGGKLTVQSKTTTTTTNTTTTTTTKLVTTTTTATSMDADGNPFVTVTKPDGSAETETDGSTPATSRIPTTNEAGTTYVTITNPDKTPVTDADGQVQTSIITTTTKATTSTTIGSGVSQATSARNPAKGGKTLATGKIVMIKSDYAETFSGNTLDDYSKPVNSYLPKYTTDVVTGDKWLGSIHYYVLGCGRRVYTSDVDVYSGDGKVTASTLKAAGTAVSADYTTIALGTSWNVPYNLKVGGQKYPYASSGSGQPEYDLTDFTATYVDITFSYTTAATGTVSVANSPLFSKAEWVTGSGNTRTLRLHLKKSGEFYGYHVSWMADGTIRFRFRHGKSAGTGSKPLTGITVMLDAGHGGDDPGTVHKIGDKSVMEKTLTLNYAKTLKARLTELGATVVMSRSTDVPLYGWEIEAMIRKNKPDISISIHMNSAGSAAYGPSVHYFYEQAFDLAENVYENVESAYLKASGRKETYLWKGYQWDPFRVCRIHDCPAILIECGFMSNPQDLECLINKTFREKFCNGIADGVVEYFK